MILRNAMGKGYFGFSFRSLLILFAPFLPCLSPFYLITLGTVVHLVIYDHLEYMVFAYLKHDMSFYVKPVIHKNIFTLWNIGSPTIVTKGVAHDRVKYGE